MNEQQEEVIALVPFKQLEENNAFIVSELLDLPAAKSTRTVSIRLNKFLVPQTAVLSRNPLGTFYQRVLTRHNPESFHAGTALAVVDLVTQSPKFTTKIISNCYHQFVNEIATYEQQVINRHRETPVAPTRAQGIILINHCLLFAEQVYRGLAVNRQHPLLRLRHETRLFAALGVDDAVMQEVMSGL